MRFSPLHGIDESTSVREGNSTVLAVHRQTVGFLFQIQRWTKKRM